MHNVDCRQLMYIHHNYLVTMNLIEDNLKTGVAQDRT